MSEFHYQFRISYTEKDGSRSVKYEYLMELPNELNELHTLLGNIRAKLIHDKCTDININIKYIDLN